MPPERQPVATPLGACEDCCLSCSRTRGTPACGKERMPIRDGGTRPSPQRVEGPVASKVLGCRQGKRDNVRTGFDGMPSRDHRIRSWDIVAQYFEQAGHATFLGSRPGIHGVVIHARRLSRFFVLQRRRACRPQLFRRPFHIRRWYCQSRETPDRGGKRRFMQGVSTLASRPTAIRGLATPRPDPTSSCVQRQSTWTDDNSRPR